MSTRPPRCVLSLRPGWLLVILLFAACSKQDGTTVHFPRPAHNEVTVMSYNLRLFSYTDRDEDGQEDDFKPEKEIATVIDLVREVSPDVLAVQEIGDASALAILKQRLDDAGLKYAHHDYLGDDDSFANLAIFSRHPITHSEPLTNLSYSIKGRPFQVLRGFQQVDIKVNGTFGFRLINVHLKSKLFHESGQTEMRRNEARLLATHIRRLEKTNTNLHLIVCGDFNDSFRSAAMRELINNPDTELEDLRLKDSVGDIWTHYYRGEQTYARIDYILVNEPMSKKWVEEKSGIVRDSRTFDASDHRPVVATFKASY